MNNFKKISDLIDYANIMDNKGNYAEANNADLKLQAIAVQLVKSKSKPNPVFDSKHPKVNDDKDHFPLGSIGQARNALARANQYDEVPDWFNGTLKQLVTEVANKVKKEYPSIEISDMAKTPKK